MYVSALCERALYNTVHYELSNSFFAAFLSVSCMSRTSLIPSKSYTLRIGTLHFSFFSYLVKFWIYSNLYGRLFDDNDSLVPPIFPRSTEEKKR